MLSVIFFTIFVALAAVVAIVATVRAVATDGYRQTPTRGYLAR